MRATPIVVVLLIVCLAGCGSTSKASRAEKLMAQSCLLYADVALSAGHADNTITLTHQQIIADMTTAASNAQTAVDLDSRWVSSAKSFASAATAMQKGNTTALKAVLPDLDRLCTPLVASVVSTPTT